MSLLKRIRETREAAAAENAPEKQDGFFSVIPSMSLHARAAARDAVVDYMERCLLVDIKENPEDTNITTCITTYTTSILGHRAIIPFASNEVTGYFPQWVRDAVTWGEDVESRVHGMDQQSIQAAVAEATKKTEQYVLAIVEMWREVHPEVPVVMDDDLDLVFTVAK